MCKKQAPTLKIANFQLGDVRDEALMVLHVVSLYKRNCRSKETVRSVLMSSLVARPHAVCDGCTRLAHTRDRLFLFHTCRHSRPVVPMPCLIAVFQAMQMCEAPYDVFCFDQTCSIDSFASLYSALHKFGITSPRGSSCLRRSCYQSACRLQAS